MSKELGNNLEYNLDDLFEGNLPEAIDLPELADTPSSVNQFTDGVSGGAIKDGELGGILQSTNFVSGSTGFKLTPSSADIPTTVLTGTLTQTQLNIANRGWVQTSAFSITDADTIAWGAGTFTSADGTAYSIGAGNTGNMSAKTYIYLDTAVSTTAYQTTTTATTAVGAGKVLIAIAQNGTGEASYKVLQGQGGENIDAANIVAGSVTANELSTSITYAGSIIIDTAGLIRSGQTAYDTGTGWFIGNVSGTPKLSIGVGGSITSSLTWDGTNLTVNGYVISGQGTFGGNGSDGALTITSGTTTISASSESVLVKNYTAISITGTGKLDFSTPNTNGTIIILKSQGNITLTSSTSAMIDCSGMGASGGAGVVAGSASNGSVGNGVIFKADYGGGALVGTGGIGGTAIVDSNGNPISTLFAQFLFNLACGGGGGGSTCLAGDIANSGSRGGGALFIQCGKAWNFTTTSGISVAGDAATACVLDSETPGGAGAGGTCMVLYNSLTANTGTINVSGGAASTCATGNLNACGGGGGASLNSTGDNGGCGASGNGGAGGNGYSYAGQNISYA